MCQLHLNPIAQKSNKVIIYALFKSIIDQVASIKSSLLLKIILEKHTTLQLFTRVIKTESIYKSY